MNQSDTDRERIKAPARLPLRRDSPVLWTPRFRAEFVDSPLRTRLIRPEDAQRSEFCQSAFRLVSRMLTWILVPVHVPKSGEFYRAGERLPVRDPWIEHLAYLMDGAIPIGRWSIGLDPLLGLVPGIGDV